jgi:hypothetical protein
MPLDGPNDDDLKKLHAEINQIVNQRVNLSTLAITVFGAINGFVFSRISFTNGAKIDSLVCLGYILFSAILWSLFNLSCQLSYAMRVYTTYLIETKKSQWETEYAEFRRAKDSPYVGYTGPQARFFLTLNAVAFVFALSPALIGEHPPKLIWMIALIVFLASTGYLGLFAYRRQGSPEKFETSAEAVWRGLNAAK